MNDRRNNKKAAFGADTLVVLPAAGNMSVALDSCPCPACLHEVRSCVLPCAGLVCPCLRAAPTLWQGCMLKQSHERLLCWGLPTPLQLLGLEHGGESPREGELVALWRLFYSMHLPSPRPAPRCCLERCYLASFSPLLSPPGPRAVGTFSPVDLLKHSCFCTFVNGVLSVLSAHL